MNTPSGQASHALFVTVTFLLGVSNLAEAASTIQFKNMPQYSVAEDLGPATVVVERVDDLESVVSVRYSTVDGTAIAGEDYTAVSGSLEFAAGETEHSIDIPIINDGVFEGAQSFNVDLAEPSAGAVLGSRWQTSVQINDNDTGIAVEYPTYQAVEDERFILIAVLRNFDIDSECSVDYATVDESATAGADYTTSSGTLTFGPSDRVKLVEIPILNDGAKENVETFTFQLSNPSQNTVVDPRRRSAVLSLLDNDGGVAFVRNQIWVQEQQGAAVLTVIRGKDGFLDPFTVDYATTGGRGSVAGTDYAETKGTLVFGAGEMVQSITVPILHQDVAKLDRLFRVVLSNPTGGVPLGAADNVTAAVTICDTREMLPHRFDSVQVSTPGMVSLRLGGGFIDGLGVVNRFQPFFDIYPIEVSENLLDWTPLTWVVRTNATTDQVTFEDPGAQGIHSRFYRTPAANLITPWPPPTGPFAVGRVDRVLTDPTRRNRYAISTNGSFMLSVWYPALRPVGAVPAAFEDDVLARDLSCWAGWVDRVPHMKSYSVLEAPFEPGLSRCPVIFFSTGLNNYRKDAVDRFELLASHGFVVMAVDHYDTYYTVFPDGTAPIGAVGRQLSAAGFQDRVRDFLFLLDEMSGWNKDDPLLAGRLDITNVGVMGFSWGGGVAAELCRVDARCRAVVLFDGTFQEAGQVNASGLSKPSLEMIASAGYGSAILFGKAEQDAIAFSISNTVHGSFSGSYWCSGWSGLPDIVQGREAARTMNDWALWFFKKHLMGSTDPMPSPADYPRAVNLKQK